MHKDIKVHYYLLNLLSQLPSWSQNQNDGSVIPQQPRLVDNMDDCWQNVCQSFPRAGLGNPHHVASRQRYRPPLSLYRSRIREALLQNLLHSVIRESALLEIDARSRHIPSLHSDLMLAAVGLDFGRGTRLDVRVGDVEVLLEWSELDGIPSYFPEIDAGLVVFETAAKVVASTAPSASETPAGVPAAPAAASIASTAVPAAKAAASVFPIT